MMLIYHDHVKLMSWFSERGRMADDDKPVKTSLHVPAIMNVKAEVSFISLYSVQTSRKAMMAPQPISPKLIMAWLRVLK